MMMKAGAFAVLALAFAITPHRAAAVEVSAGALANPLGYVGGAGLELGLGDTTGLEVRGGYLAYEYDATDYHEEGSGPMFGVRARWYAQDTGNSTGLWLAAGLSAADVTYYWRETDAGVFVEDEETTATVAIGETGVGYKVLFADERVVVDPQLLLGYFLNGETDTRVLAGLGLSVGMRF